jgi:hypothetical protein
MPRRRPDRPLGDFLQALRAEQIDCTLIGGMAAARPGAPIVTLDYALWVNLLERQYVRLLGTATRQGGSILARTLYELRDGTQVNAVFQPDGLRSFVVEWRGCQETILDGTPVRLLPLSRLIASQRASGRDKDLAMLPILRRTLRLSRRLAGAVPAPPTGDRDAPLPLTPKGPSC